MRGHLLIMAVALAAGGAAGCLGSDPPEPGQVEVQAGSAAPDDGLGFLEVEDGTPVTLVPGAQGGFHVWLGMRVHGISGRVTVERAARRASDQALVFRGLPQGLEIPEEALDGWWDSPVAAPAFMCPSPIGIQVFDEALIFEVRLLDDDDQPLAEDQLILIPGCPEGEQAAFCHDICAG